MRRSRPPSIETALDAAGIGLCLAGAGWAAVSAAVVGGSPWPVMGLFLASGASYALSLVVSARGRWLVPLVVAASVVALAWFNRADLPSARPLSGPLGYGNASAALYLQGTIAALMLARLRSSAPLKGFGLLLVVISGVATVLAGSQATGVLLVLALIAAVGPAVRWARLVIVASAGLLLAALLVSVVLGVGFRPGAQDSGLGGVVDEALSSRRPALWHDALTLLARRPLTGVGPGRFQLESPVARSDPDARWAHNGFLQQGAEGGVVGLAIVLALFAWGFVRLWAHPRLDVVTALGAVSLAALGIQACIDYMFHFPALPVVAAALVGVAASPEPVTGSELGEEDDVGRHVRT